MFYFINVYAISHPKDTNLVEYLRKLKLIQIFVQN